MTHWKKKLESIGIHTESILLPKPDIDMTRWAVVACDQYTSEPEYWNQVDAFVGNLPSTLRMIFPEVWLERETDAEQHARIQDINAAMQGYLQADLFQNVDGPILVERITKTGKRRMGVMVSVDLECYEYAKGSQSPVRATEGTIVDRLPPRIRVRRDAILETPHIMILVDDPQRTIIEPLLTSTERDEKSAGSRLLYDFSLMEQSGRLRGWQITEADTLTRFAEALADLADPLKFRNRYHAEEEFEPLPFAVGDGNHSLATAKACWDQIKTQLTAAERNSHPARYALVELVNVHDEGLLFEPIHRVLFGADRENFTRDWKEWSRKMNLRVRMEGAGSETPGNEAQTVLLVSPEGSTRMVWENPAQQLAVGSLQTFLDIWMAAHPEATLDYVHGEDVTLRLGSASGNLGFLLPVMGKESLFPTVIRDGALPRKTFSMGEAHEKRFYMECRRIR